MSKPTGISRLVLVLAAVGGAAVALAAGQQPPPQFRAGVELVTLNVTVTGPGGRYASGLSRDDFLVFEDKRPQEVTFFSRAATPLAVSLLVDTSESMRRDLPLAREGAVQFVSSLQPGDLAQIVEFDRRLRILQDFTSDQAALRDAVSRIRIGGSTSLYNAVYIGLDLFKALPAPAEDAVRRDVMVILSDGADTSSLVEFEHMLEAARRSQVVVYAIALGLTAERGPARRIHPMFALRRLAQDTGGRVLEARTAHDLVNMYQDIADELSNQYVIGYSSNQPAAAGGWRSVQVRVTEPNLQARTRAGYYAGPSAGVAGF